MAEEKRYYWIKLKTDFFGEDEIDFLLSQKNGCEYVVLYQMLCLKTANTNGKLQKNLGEIIVPYDIEKIVRDTKYFDFDTVTVALELYKRLGLVYLDENGALTIANHAYMIGSESASREAIKKRNQRIKKKMIASEDNRGDKKGTNCPIENRDKRLEIRDKSIEIDKDNIANAQLSKPDLESEFERLWSIYPNKKGKPNAFKDYVKARTRKKNPVSYEDVEKGLNAYLFYIRETKTDMQYVKHGSTWFHQECWGDDYTVVKKADEVKTNNSFIKMLQEMEKEDGY